MVTSNNVYPLDRSVEIRLRVHALLAAHKEERPKRLALDPTQCNRWSPQISLHENRDFFTVEALVPGIEPSKISIIIKNKHLVFSGERNIDDSAKTPAAHHFIRRVKLPETVDTSRMSIDYSQGAVRISTPKNRKRVA
jgi:HSP20 family molecular chaperone IbpA